MASDWAMITVAIAAAIDCCQILHGGEDVPTSLKIAMMKADGTFGGFVV